MDNTSLQAIVDDADKRQFWMKPVGDPNSPPDVCATFTSPRIRIEFAKKPTTLAVGHILCVYLVGVSKLLYIAECYTPPREATEQEIAKEPWRARWCWSVWGANLTPAYGAVWSQFALKPFALLQEYHASHPGDKQSLGAIQHGQDKQRISRGFAIYLLQRVLETT
jgi:hypothetical protein